MTKGSDIMTFLDGRKVVSYDEVVSLREQKDSRSMIAQKGGQENALASDADIVIAGGNRGGGKALADSELVCTPFGFRQIKNLKAGDIITARNGSTSRIIYVYEQGEQDVYRIEFSDGTHVDCTLDHLWNIKRTGYNHKSRWLNDTDINSEWRVWTTGMIVGFLEKQSSGKLSKTNSHLLVPLCGPVKFTRSFARCYKPKTDAYIIGLMLGDGCITESALQGEKSGKFTSMDNELVEAIKNSGIKAYGRNKEYSGNSYDYDLYNNNLREALLSTKNGRG